MNNPSQPIGLGVHFLRRPGYFGRAGGIGRGQRSNAPQYQKGLYFLVPPKVLDLPPALSYIAGWHPPTIIQAIIANRIVIKFSITTSSKA